MKKAIIGEFFKEKKKAIDRAERKNIMCRRNIFNILEFKKGFLVVSDKQLE